MDFKTLTIWFTDGTVETVRDVTRLYRGTDAIDAFHQSASFAFEQHVGAWPLPNIKKWTLT